MFNLNKDIDNEVTNKSITDYIVQIGSRKRKLLHVQSLMKTKASILNNDVKNELMQIVKPNEGVDRNYDDKNVSRDCFIV